MPLARSSASCVEFAHRDFAVAAGDFDDVGRHGDAGEAAAQGGDDGAAFVERDAVVAGAACEVKVVQVVGFDAAVEQVVHEVGECRRVGVYAFEQYGL